MAQPYALSGEIAAMTKDRLEAFSDGVLAIIITIMVLEFKTPQGTTLASLRPLVPVLGCYSLSFVFMGIYWNNHHHMLHSVKKIDGNVMWANLHLLFWLSLTPFATAWLGQSGFLCAPVATYGCVLMFSGISYYILSRTLVKANGPDSAVAKALGQDIKGKASVVIYAVALIVSRFSPMAACGFYLAVAFMWLVPDRRFTGHTHS